MGTKLVTCFADGDIPVRMLQHTQHTAFTIEYGAEISRNVGYAEAARIFGECCMHSLACAGKLENTEGDDIADALDAAS